MWTRNCKLKYRQEREGERREREVERGEGKDVHKFEMD